MTRTKSTYLALLAVLLSPMTANADLIEGLCDGTADAMVTCDNDTGLEWLDIDLTAGLSLDDFNADVGGWLSAGWVIARDSEVTTFFTNGGFTDLSGNGAASQFGTAQFMIDLVGIVSGTFRDSYGQGHSISTQQPGRANVGFYQVNVGAATGRAYSPLCCNNFDTASNNYGVWAYRQGSTATVPEPGTLALLGLSLAGMGMTRRKKKV